MIMQLPTTIRRILLLLPALLASFGCYSLFVYFANPKPLEISIEQLISNPPRAKWLRVTGRRINMIDAVASRKRFSDKINLVYIPIRPKDTEESTVSVLLLSSDPELLALAGRIHALDGSDNGGNEASNIAMENARIFAQNRSFEGLVQFGIGQDDRVTFQLRKRLSNLVEEPIIIEEGKEPTIIEGLGMLLVAFLMAVGISSIPKSGEITPPPLPPTPPPLPRST